MIKRITLREATRSVVERGFAVYHIGTEQFIEDENGAIVFTDKVKAEEHRQRLCEKWQDSEGIESFLKVTNVSFKLFV